MSDVVIIDLTPLPPAIAAGDPAWLDRSLAQAAATDARASKDAAATSATAASTSATDASASKDAATASATAASTSATSASASKDAAAASAASAAASGFPPGAILDFASSSAPAGWFKSNGAAVSRTTYAALYASIGTTFGAGDGSTTFNLPDLRGEFRRGLDDGRGVDTGRTLGSAQGDAFQGHRHAVSASLMVWVTGTAFGGNAVGANGGSVLNPTTDGTNGTPRTASETRPRNVALLTCIKY